ncbi:MAG: heme lyase CcmF/NrfE family subunit, partial [Actinomycetota bacterium]
MLGQSLNGLLGHSVLIIGLVASAFGALVTVVGTTRRDARVLRSAPNYAWLALAAAVAALVVMWRALLTYDFSLAYVQQVGSRSTPLLF